MRGKNLIETRKKCVDILNKLNIPKTLVATNEKNSNDDLKIILKKKNVYMKKTKPL